MSLDFNTTFQGPVECTNKRIATVSDTTVDVYFDLMTKVDTVFIGWYSNYTLCSVHISGGRCHGIQTTLCARCT